MGLALPQERPRCRPCGILRATIPIAIRAPRRKDGLMKRAARHKTGSVVFDKDARRGISCGGRKEGRSRLIGTLRQYQQREPRSGQRTRSNHRGAKPTPSEAETVTTLAARYEAERFPARLSTARVYRFWLYNYVLPEWGNKRITEIQPRPVELWCDLSRSRQKANRMCETAVHAHGFCNVGAGRCRLPEIR